MPGTFTPELTFGPYQSGMWQETGGLSYRTLLLNSLALSLDFTTSIILDSRVSATGGANGTVTNSSGVLVTASAPRFDYSPTALGTLKGLLVEESRTNLFLNSDLIGTNLATQNVTVTAQPYTITFYGTGSITLYGAATATINGTGAYPTRVVSTFTPTAGMLTCTVAGTVQYAQIEAGSFETSFIPTAGATVTRSADVLTMSGTNFTSWFNGASGTFITEAIPPVNTGVLRWLICDTSVGKGGFISSAGNASSGLVFGGDATSANTVNYGKNSVNKFAFAYDGTNAAITCLNGGAVATGTNDWHTGSSGITLASRTGGFQPLNGWLRKVSFYNSRLPNGQLQSLTT